MIRPFKFWASKVLPAVYDETLSYYEVLCKTVDKLNEVINSQNELSNDFNNLVILQNELQEFVTNYFDNLDVQTEIDNKLDELVENGTLDDIVGKYINNSFITPEMFGAVGDGITDDTEAFQKTVNLIIERNGVYIKNNPTIQLSANKKYLIKNKVYIDHPITVIGATNSFIQTIQNGEFIFTRPLIDDYRQYHIGDYMCELLDTSISNPLDSISNYTNIKVCTKIEIVNDNPVYTWETTDFKCLDEKGSIYQGTGTKWNNVAFSYCDKVFRGDRFIYHTFSECLFHHINIIFDCMGTSDSYSKQAQWFGKYDINNCDIRYVREIFRLTKEFYASGATLSVNAVNINGGVINTSNFFIQSYKNVRIDPDHVGKYLIDGGINFKNNFRVESMNINGCDIENVDYFFAINKDPDNGYGMTNNQYSNNKVRWIGGLYLYNIIFDGCHFENFGFIYHGYYNQYQEPSYPSAYYAGLVRSQVSFLNSYFQYPNNSKRRLIDCSDDNNMSAGTFGSVIFNVSLINCPMTIYARATGNNHTVGNSNYLADQYTFPIVKFKTNKYIALFENLENNCFLYKFDVTIQKLDTAYIVLTQDEINAVCNEDYITSPENANLIAGLIHQRLECNNAIAELLNITESELNNMSVAQISNTIYNISEEDQTTLLGIINVHLLASDTTEFLDNENASTYISANKKYIDLHIPSDSNDVQYAYYNGTIPHRINDANRVLTTYYAAQRNNEFLNQLTGGTILGFLANSRPDLYETNVSYVQNISNQGLFVYDICNNNNLRYLSLRNGFNGKLKNSTQPNPVWFKNCNKLETVRIEFTPTSIENAIPGTAFNDCNSLANIYCQFPSTDSIACTNAPWTNIRPVKVHYTDTTISYN